MLLVLAARNWACSCLSGAVDAFMQHPLAARRAKACQLVWVSFIMCASLYAAAPGSKQRSLRWFKQHQR